MTRELALLSRAWWMVGPLFLVLAARFAVDRACADPYNLVPSLASRPLPAWAMAVVYVLTHLWLLGAYLQAAISTGSLLPSPRSVRAMWGRDEWKLWVLLFAAAIEYAPLVLFRAAARLCG